MGARFGSLIVVPWILFAQMSWDMAVPIITATPPRSEVIAEVLDRGGVFSRGAGRRARKALRQIRREHRISILIETVDTLGSESVDDAAQRRARPLGAGGVYILVAGLERDVSVVVARRRSDGRPSDAERAAIRNAFLGPLRAGDPDGGLEQGIRAIRTTRADPAGPKPKSGGWDALISVATLLGFLGILLASRFRCDRRSTGARRGREQGPRPGHVARGLLPPSHVVRANPHDPGESGCGSDLRRGSDVQ